MKATQLLPTHTERRKLVFEYGAGVCSRSSALLASPLPQREDGSGRMHVSYGCSLGETFPSADGFWLFCQFSRFSALSSSCAG